MNTFPLVGAFFRPPAKALIDALSIGTPLLLIAEPDNQFDPNAVAVWLHAKDIPENGKRLLEETLPPFGFSLENILEAEEWHLGYIKKEFALQLRCCGAVPLNSAVPATFCLSPSGSPQVHL